MNVKVRFLKPFSALIGKDEIIVKIAKNSNLENLLFELVKLYPNLEKELFETKRKLKDYFNLMINNRLVFSEKLAEEPLKENDEIVIFMAVGGG